MTRYIVFLCLRCVMWYKRNKHMETLTSYLTDPGVSREEKVLEILRYFYGGFLTISEYHELLSVHSLGDMHTMAAVEELIAENQEYLPTSAPEKGARLSGMHLRKFLFDIDEAKELIRGDNYFDVWKLRLDSPQGYAVPYIDEGQEITEEDQWYTIHAYEEYALNRIGSNLVTRTTTKIALADADPVEARGGDGPGGRLVEDVVTIFPDMSETELAGVTHAVTSMDGGFRFTAIAQLVRLEDNIRVKYHCPARKAFVVKAFVAKDPHVTAAG